VPGLLREDDDDCVEEAGEGERGEVVEETDLEEMATDGVEEEAGGEAQSEGDAEELDGQRSPYGDEGDVLSVSSPQQTGTVTTSRP
jgi:hypothetical protein